MKMYTRRSLLSASVFCLASITQLAAADGGSWQMSNLFEPNPAQLEREKTGHVMIYHRIKDIDVNRAMDEQFERIESMMFTSTIVTNDTGQPLRDPTTGELVTEDDGCD